jgi:uncharacterized protein YabN with tetrapyrrole methylase and pyrophosphatase domain
MPGRDPCQALLELLATMHALRAPDGCPWDVEQTPESLAPYILEEACEAIEAIETGSPERIADELGDLLLQIVFQAEIATERGQFDFADIAIGITSKLVRRHPHVFAGNGTTATSADLARQWDSIKRAEQTSHPQQSANPLGQLPGNLPALQRAQKLIGRAMRSGLDIGHWLPLPANAGELDEESLGKNLLELARKAELRGLDAEQALRRTVQKILSEANPANASTNIKT